MLRPSVKIDYRRLEDFVRDKTVVVTGGGGSIGSEICDRVVNFGAGRLLIIENSEPALHAVLEQLAARSSATLVEGRIADIRDRERIFGLITEFKPNLVFHAAALKHVPLLERDWDEGIKTNVFGSVNVADAALDAGADAMVMISTDKAIDPVSVLGATKRLAEMYCQALDAGGRGVRHANGGKLPMRMIAVRFGNVLASNGSVVPKFKAQIEAGGPVTVTHPDMVRYFMTIREACDLVITAATHALRPSRSDTSVYVLNMGQPIKIVDLAERLIRLSGLEPGRDVDIVFTGIRPGERMNADSVRQRGRKLGDRHRRRRGRQAGLPANGNSAGLDRQAQAGARCRRTGGDLRSVAHGGAKLSWKFRGDRQAIKLFVSGEGIMKIILRSLAQRLAHVGAAAGAVIFSLALTFGVAQAQDKTYTMKISIATINDQIHAFVKDFAAALDKNSDGARKGRMKCVLVD